MNARQLEVAKGLFRLAWADGVVQPQEVEVVARLLERMGVGLAERLALMDEALSLPYANLPDLDSVLPNRESRLAVMSQLASLCFADGVAQPQELQIVGALAMHWGIGADELEALRLRAQA